MQLRLHPLFDLFIDIGIVLYQELVLCLTFNQNMDILLIALINIILN